MSKRPPKGPPKDKAAAGDTALPSKQQIIDFIAESEGKVGKREIARAFGIRGNDKIGLKRLIGELGQDGTLAGHRKHLRQAGHLPAVTTLDITGRDPEGDLTAEPVEWDEEGPPPRVLITNVRETPGEAAIGVGDRVLAKLTRADPDETGGALYEASVVKRIAREKRRQLGIFRAAKGGGGTIEPIDRKELRSFPVARLNEGNAKDGDLVRFEMLRGTRLGPQQVKIQSVLGNPDDQRQISLIAVHAHGIPDDFPQAVIDEAEGLSEPTLDGRADLRELPLLTIDPIDARDHDDAVHAAPDDDPKNPGGFILTVAIADVAQFVRPFSRLDREAQLRGNSVYFPDRVVPMLPERISNDLCSLREGQDRSVLVARMTFDAHGHKKRHTFLRALMRSAAKLSYEEAQAAIDGKPSDKCVPLMDTALRPLWDAYAKLSSARDHRSPLDLDLPERKIRLDGHGRVARVERPERLDAHRLIEECMIQANVAAAETVEGKRGTVVYRIHDQPSKEKLKGLRDFLDSLDLKLPPDGQLTPAALNKVLAEAKRFPVPDLISEVVLRSQSQAEYNIENIGHFGLNLQRYAHFTSPIRRYADLLVHRALIRFCKLGEGGLEDEEVPRLRKLAELISQAERRAMAAERETSDRLIAAHLADRIGASFAARVAGVTRSGLFVRLKDTGADGFIPISSLADEYMIHVEAAHALVGQRSAKGYQLGDEVEVKLLEAIPAAGALRFQMMTAARAQPQARARPWRAAFATRHVQGTLAAPASLGLIDVRLGSSLCARDHSGARAGDDEATMEDRSTWTALQNGLRLKCPACGKGPLYSSYLKSVDRCATCGTELHHHRADDAPAYFTILVVAHIVGAGIMFSEMTWHPADWVQWIIWIPALLILSLFLLPRFKGALIGVQWANRMHGFGGAAGAVTYAEGVAKKPLG